GNQPMIKHLGAAAALALMMPLAPSAGGDAKPFPQPGSRVPGAFSVLVINGNWKDSGGNPVYRHHSPVTEFGLKPVVLVFVAKDQHKDKEVHAFLKKLDAKVAANKGANLKGAVIFLAHDAKRNLAAGDADKAEPGELLKLANEEENLIRDLQGKNEKTE